MHPSEIPLHCAKSASLKRVYLINVSVLCGFASFRALCFCQTLSLSFFHSPIDSSARAGALRAASACHHSFIGPGRRFPPCLCLSSLFHRPGQRFPRCLCLSSLFHQPGQRFPRSLCLSSLMIMTRRLYGFEPFIKLGRLFFTIKNCCKGHIFYCFGHHYLNVIN